MRLKSFTAPTATEAMAQLRAVLGDDAVIVSTREDEDGGICITAAVDEADTALEERKVAHGRMSRDRAGTSAEAPTSETVVDTVYKAFRRHGVPALIGEWLLEQVAGYETRDPLAALTAVLRQTFRFAPTGSPSPTGREHEPMMLVGPPGAGKTQTAAKQAAYGLMTGRRVRLVTTDTERTGGSATLAAFAQGLKLPLVRAGSPEALSGTLGGFGESDLAIIDSAGRNHLDSDDLTELGRFLVIGKIEPVLVAPAGLDPVEVADIAQIYKDLGVRRLIITRLDLARRVGSVLASAYSTGLAFADFGTTARIKDGLKPADALTLARIILSPGRSDTLRPPQTGISI